MFPGTAARSQIRGGDSWLSHWLFGCQPHFTQVLHDHSWKVFRPHGCRVGNCLLLTDCFAQMAISNMSWHPQTSLATCAIVYYDWTMGHFSTACGVLCPLVMHGVWSKILAFASVLFDVPTDCGAFLGRSFLTARGAFWMRGWPIFPQ